MKIDGSENFRFEELADLDMDLEKKAMTSERSFSSSSSSSETPSLAAKAIRASSAHRDSSLSSAYSSPSPARAPPMFASSIEQEVKPHEYTSMKSLNEPKRSFWGTLASKAKALLDEDDPNIPSQSPSRTPQDMPSQALGTKEASKMGKKVENHSLQRSLDAITSSLNYIGGTIGSVVEEGFTVVENRTAGIIQETRKKIKKKPGSGSVSRNQAVKQSQPNQQNSQTLTDLEIQLKASRDVAMAMATKAKLLLRELKTVKADLAFAKQRCAQLEEENKVLRESHNRGDSPEDDDLIRLQLETLLAEKARLAHENSVYARENRFLREVVEYHQLTMQDVVYLDEKTEEVTEVYPVKVTSVSNVAPPEFTEIFPTPPNSKAKEPK
ncbi:PREDICTED: uncharacterized protein LOC104826259 [Tarenaya hassleriana]|uniref:uncharacterized protein LOC104826259 n=1 Tax=Tarenaya hassleriana TaxID=28532 RepID=UPI00053C7B1E|nr:PREDICTED: uncharacterized protein LOC104826259 [Tarenaya hassleriana]